MTEAASQLRRCPKCEYDMSGVPGLLCPECGETWTEEQLVVRPKVQEGWPANWLLVGAFLVLMFSQISDGTIFAITMTGLVWGMALTWIYLRRASICSNKPWLLWWIVYLSAMTIEVVDSLNWPTWTRWAPEIVLVSVIMFGLIVSARRFIVGTLVAVFFILVITGMMGAVFSTMSIAGFSDNFSNVVLGYEISGTRGALISLGIDCAFVATGVVGLWVIERLRRPRPQSKDSA